MWVVTWCNRKRDLNVLKCIGLRSKELVASDNVIDFAGLSELRVLVAGGPECKD